MSDTLAALRRALNRPMFGTVDIQADARVDPAGFPEDEFPVRCLTCDYELRGLYEQRCPECGEAFDRGRLLVVQYAVRPTNVRISDRQQRMLLWLALAAIGVFLLNYGGFYILAGRLSSTANPAWSTPGTLQTALDHMILYTRVFTILQAIVLLTLIGAIVRIALAFRRKAAQRQRILEAIQNSMCSR